VVSHGVDPPADPAFWQPGIQGSPVAFRLHTFFEPRTFVNSLYLLDNRIIIDCGFWGEEANAKKDRL
jgi:hypothetical protein